MGNLMSSSTGPCDITGSCDSPGTRTQANQTMAEALPTVSEYNEITKTNALESPLLRLPGELRQQIYEYAFSGGVAYVLPEGFKFKGNSRARYSENAFGLRFVCRQLRAETRAAFYKSYWFDFTGCKGILELAEKIPSYEITSVENVRFGVGATRELYSEYLVGVRHLQFKNAFRALKCLEMQMFSDNHPTGLYSWKVYDIKMVLEKPDLKIPSLDERSFF